MRTTKYIYLLLFVLANRSDAQFVSTKDTSYNLCRSQTTSFTEYHNYDTTHNFKLYTSTNSSSWNLEDDTLVINKKSFLNINIDFNRFSVKLLYARVIVFDSNGLNIDTSRLLTINLDDSLDFKFENKQFKQCEYSKDTIIFDVNDYRGQLYWEFKNAGLWKRVSLDTSLRSNTTEKLDSLAFQYDDVLNGLSFRLVGSNYCGLQTSDSIVINTKFSPVITQTKFDTLSCSKDSLLFRAVGSGADISYKWYYRKSNTKWNILDSSFDNGNGKIKDSILVWSRPSSMMDSTWIKVGVDGVCGNEQFDSVRVKILVEPKVNLYSADTSVCESQVVELKSNLTGTNLRYQWQVQTSKGFEDILTSSTFFNGSTTSNISYKGYENHDTVNLRLKYFGECIDSVVLASINLTVYKAPVINEIIGDTVLCENSDLHLEARADGESLKYQWWMKLSNGTTYNLINQNYKGLFSGQSTNKLSAYGIPIVLDSARFYVAVAGFCSPDTTSGFTRLIVDVPPNIANQLNGVKRLCAYDSFVINPTIKGSRLSQVWEYYNDKNGVWASILSDSLHTYKMSEYKLLINGNLKYSNRKLRLKLQNLGCGSKTSDDFELLFQALPILEFSVDKDTICSGDQSKLTVFNRMDVDKILPADARQISDTSFEFKPIKSTHYLIQYSDDFGCKADSFIDLVVFKLNNFRFINNSKVLCDEDSLRIDVNGLKTGLTVSWKYNGNLYNSVGPRFRSVVKYPEREVGVIINNTLGCKFDTSLNLNVFQRPKISIFGSEEICVGEYFDLVAVGADSFIWDASNSSFSTTNIYRTNPIKSKWLNIDFANQYGCYNQDSIFLEVHDLPKSNFRDTSFCINEAKIIKVINNHNYHFEFSPDWLVADNGNGIVQYIGMNTNNLRIKHTDSNNCMFTDTILVQITPLPTISITKDTSICEGQRLKVKIPQFPSIDWEPKQIVDNPFSETPTINTPKSIWVKTTFIDSNNCQGSDSIFVNVVPKPKEKVSGDSIFCKNASFLKFNATSNFNGEHHWSVKNGEIQQEASNRRLFVKAFNKNLEVIFVQTIKSHPYCSDTVNFISIIRSNSETAPLTSIRQKKVASDKILLFADNYGLDFYEWGKEHKDNNKQVVINKGIRFIEINTLDTVNWAYYLRSGSDSVCPSIDYFNTQYTNEIDYVADDRFIIENPISDHLRLRDVTKFSNMKILDSKGQLLFSQDITPLSKNDILIPENIITGQYFLFLRSMDGALYKSKLQIIK